MNFSLPAGRGFEIDLLWKPYTGVKLVIHAYIILCNSVNFASMWARLYEKTVRYGQFCKSFVIFVRSLILN